MKKIVLTYGLISGVIFAITLIAGTFFQEQIGYDHAEYLGYTTMVAAFVIVYFGVRSYRDNVLGGAIKFGAAFRAGLLITLISCACYVASWEFVYYKLAPDFYEKYAAHAVEKAKAAGMSQTKIDAQAVEMKKMADMYKNPAVNVAMTFVEVFPIGLVFALVGAVLLSRQKKLL